ncbi:hypothetical protein Slin15195_G090160 [Septoria linicola]|uniref:Uncharacterized protein n=1 Tax=Septoria linicola TaxID=215465 RepID=A0A9Q9EMN3_9PEZI|nr:hypothetical protein Slin15195_G090160 [Septoria linicola]
MLSARRVSLRIAVQPWSAEATCARRFFSERKGASPNNANTNHQSQDGAQRMSNGSASRTQSAALTSDESSKAVSAKPSLIEQLFPEETKRYEEQQRQAAREIPQLPLENLAAPGRPPKILRPTRRASEVESVKEWSPRERKAEGRLRGIMAAEPSGTAVLVLRNASKNLTEEDFRRLIPQGKHIEGWTLQDGDVLRVVPGRNMDTLEQQNVYYILFTSQLSAHTYQWHVTRIHKLAALHTPTSNTSPIPPPPGYMIEGLDAHAAIQAYALVPPSQRLELRQLNRPFPPLVQSIVKFEGYRSIVQRPDKLPFEVRLTMEGPQLQANTIRHIMLETGKQRNLSWSGGDKYNMQITKWEPVVAPKARDISEFAAKNAPGIRDERASDLSGRQLSNAQAASEERGARLHRTPPHVFILGFYTEIAAQSFITYWHKRSLELPGKEVAETDDDLPPIAHVEMLW